VVEQADDQQPHQVMEPVEQESIPFHGEQIIAVRLSDGRVAVVLRWVCAGLNIDPQAQVRRIQRTASIAGELLRVRVQTTGGRQVMPALTLRGFPTWILGINPNEVKDDPSRLGHAEHIRQMIIAYQVEAVDVLYSYFAQKAHPAFPESREGRSMVREQVIQLEPMKPVQEPPSEASHAELATYHEAMALWHRWQADQYAQQWRGEIEEWRGTVEARLEGDKELLKLIPEIIDRVGSRIITAQQQQVIRGMVKQLSESSGITYQTIYWELAQGFKVPRYDELLESQYDAVCKWFNHRIEQVQKPREKS